MNKRNLSEPVFDIQIHRDIKVPMRDGVHLSGNLFLPKTEGVFPLIFQRMPYGWSGCELGEFYARRGYAYMIQDCRGRYDSGGVFYPFADDAHDGYDTLDWVVSQKWSNGRVGMFGPSYLGAVQWLLACKGHPSLKAIVPNVMPCDLWREAYWHDGAFSLALNALWTCLEISSRTSDLDMIPSYDLNKFFRHLPLSTFDEAAGMRSRFWQDFLTHSQYSDYWGKKSVHNRLHQICMPVFIMGGWYDYYPRDAFRSFCKLQEIAISKGIRNQHRIIIGPWSHLISQGPTLGEVDFGEDSHIDINALALRWFDFFLKDINTGIQNKPPVAIFVMGVNKWRYEHKWPLVNTRFTEYYFHSNGKAGSDPEDGILSITLPGDEPPDRYTYDPTDPVPTLGGNHSICWGAAFHIIRPGPFDQRKIEARKDVLVYSTATLHVPLEVIGPVKITLYAVTDVPDTDWTAKLVDVHPDGRAINLTEGIIRARFRESIYKPPKLLEPGKVYKYTIELQPTGNVFLPGHRIRVDVTSSNFPLWDRNPNTGHEQGRDAEVRVANQTVLHDSRYPSRITLPVIMDESNRKGAREVH